MRRGSARVLVTLALASVALSVAPARASSVAITFGLSAGTDAPTGVLCPLSVPALSDGITVLEAAKAAGCIESYKTTSFGDGTYVKCINDVCGPPESTAGDLWMVPTYWAIYENGAYSDVGVDGLRAHAGDEFVFAYEQWATCLVGVGCGL